MRLAPEPLPVSRDRWLVPLRGLWFTRAADAPESWSPAGVRLPVEVAPKPGVAYRLALDPDTTDTELAGLRSLAGFPGLEAVDLSGCRAVTDAGVLRLADLRGLKAVGLGQTQVTDAGLALLLTRFPDLEVIALAGAANLTEAVAAPLLRLRKLKALTLPPRADTADVRAEFARRRPGCRLE